ncbi:MAG: lysophospholipid acyltransferase family protein [Candidatus Limnocylindrales bacterium]
MTEQSSVEIVRGDRPATSRPVGGLAHGPLKRTSQGSWVGRALVRLNERAVVLGYRFASWLLGVVPLGISLPLAGGAMRVAWVVWPAKRRVILANASHILGRPTDDPAVRRLAGRVYQTYGRYIVELMRLPSLPPEAPAAMMDSRGERGVDAFAELWARLEAEGRGIIALSIHIGSIETLIAAMAARGFPTYGLADDSSYPELYALLQAQRKRWGVDVFPWKQLRRVYAVLRQPALLGLLVDWGYRADGIPVRLFGDWTTLPAGPAVLAAKTNAVIVPIVCRRLPGGRFSAEWLDPIEVVDDDPATISAATQAVAYALEGMVRPAPEQWYTFKPIWPTSVDEAAELAARVTSS